jgi:transposase-like protein
MNTTTFTASQQAALGAIADGANITEAAPVAGVHRDTIYHWAHTLPKRKRTGMRISSCVTDRTLR